MKEEKRLYFARNVISYGCDRCIVAFNYPKRNSATFRGTREGVAMPM